MNQEVACEWCNDVSQYRLFCRDRRYERYACEKHVKTIKREAVLDGYSSSDVEEGWSLTGPYLFSDMLFKTSP